MTIGKKLITHGLIKPDYEEWADSSYWTVTQAIFLSLNIDPFNAEEDRSGFLSSPLYAEFKDIRERVIAAIGKKKLLEPISPAKFVNWCDSNGVLFPFQLHVMLDPNTVDQPLRQRERTTLLNIIGVLLELLCEKPKAKLNSLSRNQTSIVAEIIEKHRHIEGLKERTLHAKFSEARKSLKDSREQ